VNPAKSIELAIVNRQVFSDELVVIRLKGSTGFAIRCHRPGAYVMAYASMTVGGDSWRTPLSVLSVNEAEGTVDFLVRICGPKSAWLAGPDRETWILSGPFYNGLLNLGSLKPGRKTLAMVRGTALAPYLCVGPWLLGATGSQAEWGKADWGDGLRSGKADWGGAPAEAGAEADLGAPAEGPAPQLYLDGAGLPVSFLGDYLAGQVYTSMDLQEETTLQAMKWRLETALRDKALWNVMLLVSPYFAEKLMADLEEEEAGRVIRPNPANLCCGEGFCGACAHTDADGQTVRLCKCNHWW
jgi:hypothetical protein